MSCPYFTHLSLHDALPCYIPLIGEPRLDHHARAIAIRRLDDAILDALEQAGLVEQRHDALARREPVEADQVGGDEAVGGLRDLGRGIEHVRSEEHTSELQSPMRNSYAVFCLQKKKS